MIEKDIAQNFMEGIVSDRVSEAYEKYTAEDFVHHNPYFKSDRNSLMQGMIESNRIKSLKLKKLFVIYLMFQFFLILKLVKRCPFQWYTYTDLKIVK